MRDPEISFQQFPRNIITIPLGNPYEILRYSEYELRQYYGEKV